MADTVFWGVPIKKRAEVRLRRLSTGNSFRTISKAFGTGKSTVIKLFNELFLSWFRCLKILSEFRKQIQKLGQKSEDFPILLVVKSHTSLEQLMMGMHIEILAPSSDSKKICLSLRQNFTVNTEAVIVANIKFF